MSKEIDIKDLRKFLSGAAKVTKKPNAKRVMQQVVEETKKDLNKGFETGTAPDGSKWAPLARPRKPPHNPENKPLLDFFNLQKSVVEGGQDHLKAVSNEGLVLGTYVFYAMFHQNGTSRLPKREFMAFSEPVQDKAAELTADSIINQIDKL